jgi:hypothetical protein
MYIPPDSSKEASHVWPSMLDMSFNGGFRTSNLTATPSGLVRPAKM